MTPAAPQSASPRAIAKPIPEVETRHDRSLAAQIDDHAAAS